MGDLETDNATDLPNSQDNQPNNVAVQQPPGSPTSGAAPAGKQVLQIPSDRVKQIKDKARNKGKNEFKRQLDAQAKELGFRDHEDLMAHAKNNRQQQGNRQNVASQPNTARTERSGNDRGGGQLRVVTNQDGERSVRQLQRQVQRLTQENERLRASRQKESHARGKAEVRVKELEGQIAAIEARTELQMKAMQAGIRDPKHIRFALAELQDHLQGKTDAELTALDELGFLKDLQKEHPYLFGVQEAPASSTPTKEPKDGAPPAKEPPPPPASAKDGAPPPAPHEKFDAMDGDLNDANSRLAASGLSFQFQRRLPQEQARANRQPPPNR